MIGIEAESRGNDFISKDEMLHIGIACIFLENEIFLVGNIATRQITLSIMQLGVAIQSVQSLNPILTEALPLCYRSMKDVMANLYFLCGQ